jgi:dipeptidyl aminopeptidase/acylaminoacyl peptidase
MYYRSLLSIIAIAASALSPLAQEAPTGTAAEMSESDQKALQELKGKVVGKIVWSTSRAHSRHDIWIMNADGSDQKKLTSSPDNVDWFPRFSPDGSKVLFVRSRMGWTPESEAEVFDKWDLWIVPSGGGDEKKAAESACWGTWRPSGDSICFARGPKVFLRSLTTGEEKELFDAEKQFKKRTFAQQPELSPNGKFLAMTLRGSTRQTGIWNLEKKEWNSTGGGCQMDWFPSGNTVVRMNEGQGNGNTEVLKIDIDKDGKPLERISGLSVPKEIRFMDLPGRRSHEYFPKIDPTGQWMVWCATQYGHEHDLYDYEVYLWKIGADQKSAVRLTFHTGNDRWPDIYTSASKPAVPAAPDTVPAGK